MRISNIFNDKDKRIGVFSSFLVLLLAFIYLYITKFEVADPPPTEIPMKMQLPISALNFENLKVETSSSSGGGKASNTKESIKTTTQTEKVITSNKTRNTKIKSGENISKNENNPAEETKNKKSKTVDYFSGGDQGSNDKGGVGIGNSKDTGPDLGTNGLNKGRGKSGGDFKRIRQNDPYIDHIESDANYIIQLRVKIDEQGNVIDAQYTSRTTTTSQIIINKVISATVSQVKYNKKPGAGVEEAYIDIKIRAK